MEDKNLDEVMNRLANEYKKLLKNNVNKKNSMIELLKLDDRVKKYCLLNNTFSYIPILLLTITEIYAILVICLGMSFFKTSYEMLIFMITLLIIILCQFNIILCYFGLTKFPIKKINMEKIDFEIIKKCNFIEGIANDLNVENNRIFKNQKEALKYLYNSDFISNDEKNILNELIDIRNCIMHGNKNKYSYMQKDIILKKSSKTLNRLNAIMK